MAFDLTIKDVDAFTLEHIPVLLDLLRNERKYPEITQVAMLRDLLEQSADSLMIINGLWPQERKDFRVAFSEALREFSQQLSALSEEWQEADA